MRLTSQRSCTLGTQPQARSATSRTGGPEQQVGSRIHQIKDMHAWMIGADHLIVQNRRLAVDKPVQLGQAMAETPWVTVGQRYWAS